MRNHIRSIFVANVLALCVAGSMVQAQGSLREQTATAGATPRQVISVNPFLPLAGYFQGEYERRVQDNVSVAVSASFAKFDSRRYQNLDVKLRLYPQERALEGLGLAAGLGLGRALEDDELLPCEPVETCTPQLKPGKYASAPTFSVEGQYQWLFGRTKATAVTVGGGVKRYFFGNDAAQNIQEFVPTGRLTIGWAFR